MKKLSVLFVLLFSIIVLPNLALGQEDDDQDADLKAIENELIEMRAKGVDEFASENAQVADMVTQSKTEIQELKRRNTSLAKEIELLLTENEGFASLNLRILAQNDAILKETETLMKADKEENEDEIRENEEIVQKNQDKIAAYQQLIDENELTIKRYNNAIEDNEEEIERLEETIADFQNVMESNDNIAVTKGRKN
jgi:chromosome segregation ATPase